MSFFNDILCRLMSLVFHCVSCSVIFVLFHFSKLVCKQMQPVNFDNCSPNIQVSIGDVKLFWNITPNVNQNFGQNQVICRTFAVFLADFATFATN